MRWQLRFLLIVTAVALPLSAQQESTLQEHARSLSVHTDFVLVPVIVTDKSGDPVSGLSKNAFRVEENGKSRTVSFFEEMQTQKLTAFPPRSSTSANFLPYDERLRLTVVLIDMVNTPWLRQVEAKKQLADYLLQVSNQGEPIALFGLNSAGLRQLHPFATDTKVLVLALQKLKLSLSSEESTQPPSTFTDDPTIDGEATYEEQLLSDMLQDLNDTVAADYQRMATRQTLSAMTQFAHALGTLPGRKTLVWATAGFPFTIDDPNSFARQGDDLRPEYEEAWRSLNSANIAVYPVDVGSVDYTAKGLPSANATVSKTQINSIRGMNGSLRSPMNLPYDQGVQQRLTMHAFADATGGRACITISELDKCFAQAVEDSRDYYLLGYYLGDDTQPGWRKLKVKVAGDGLHVRYRTGFYVASKTQETPEQNRQKLVDALASVVQYTGVRLTARLASEQDPPDSSTSAQRTTAERQAKPVAFLLGVMGDSLTVDRDNGNSVDLQIAALAFDTNRKTVASSSQALATSFKPEMLQKILQSGLGVPQKLDLLPPGEYEIKFAVR